MKRSATFLFFFLLLTAAHTSFAQLQWENDYLYSDYTVNNTVEAANTVIETSDGGYLIGGTAERSPRTAFMAKIDANGDSLWTRYYDASYGNFYGLSKLYRDIDDKLYGVFEPLYGRITFVELDETNGDTLSSFMGPMGPASTNHYYAHTQLPDGDYILSYTSGSASIVKRFTPGNLNGAWSIDYASQAFQITSMILDGSDVVMSGYCGSPVLWYYDLGVTKVAVADGTVHWAETYFRDALWRDRGVGIQKNSAGDYLIAASFSFANVLKPSVLRVSGADGDSLSLSTLSMHNGNPVNFGFCIDLEPFGGGFVATGEIDQNFNDPNGSPQNCGQMALFCISDNGEIANSYAYNATGAYISGFGPSGTHAWGLDCIPTSDNHVVFAGRGNYITDYNGWPQAFGDAYVIKLAPDMLFVAEQNEIAGLVAWPNPSEGKVRFAASESLEKIVIYDRLGAVVTEIAPGRESTCTLFPGGTERAAASW
jgi:hypothetical protein